MRFLPIFLFLLFLVFVPSFGSSRRVASFGHVESWQSVGRSDPNRLIPVTLALKQKDPQALDRLFHAISDPDNQRYSQCATHSELRSILSDPAAVSGTVEWLQANGAKEVNVHPTGDLVKAKFTVGEFERLFHSEVHDFKPSRPGVRSTIRRTHAFTMPEQIKPFVEHLFTVNHFPSVRPPRVFSNKPLDSQGNVDPATMNSVYGIDSNTVTNSKATQGVFESDMQSYNQDDLAAYQKQFNLPVDQSMVSVYGPNDPQSCVTNPDNCGESMLDIEIINAIAQKAKLVFYGIDQNDPTPFIDWITQLTGMSNPPLVNSVSYGEDETKLDPSIPGRFNTEIQKAGAMCISVLVSSGDDGAAGAGARGNVPAGCGLFPSYPASSPFVTAVGATQGPEAGQPEIVCASNTNGLITSGGGFSTVWSQPSYQQTAVQQYLSQRNSAFPPSSMFNSSHRGYPDVALLGHNYYVVTGGQTAIESGTSASAPFMAGILTLINNARFNANKGPIGFPNPALYKIWAQNRQAFNDVTSGNNNCPVLQGSDGQCCENGWPATSGWDAVTGLGSVNFPALKRGFLNLP